jgi:hypothetical protein
MLLTTQSLTVVIFGVCAAEIVAASSTLSNLSSLKALVAAANGSGTLPCWAGLTARPATQTRHFSVFRLLGGYFIFYESKISADWVLSYVVIKLFTFTQLALITAYEITCPKYIGVDSEKANVIISRSLRRTNNTGITLV